MNNLLERTLAWKMVWFKGLLLTLVNMIAVLIASLQGFTKDYVADMGWWSWCIIIGAPLVVGCNTIISYMDKTFHIEGDQVALANTKLEAQGLANAKVEAKIEAEAEAKKPA